MPIAKIQLLNGKIGRFEVAEGTSPEQVMDFVSKNMKQFDMPIDDTPLEAYSQEPLMPNTQAPQQSDVMLPTQQTAEESKQGFENVQLKKERESSLWGAGGILDRGGKAIQELPVVGGIVTGTEDLVLGAAQGLSNLVMPNTLGRPMNEYMQKREQDLQNRLPQGNQNARIATNVLAPAPSKGIVAGSIAGALTSPYTGGGDAGDYLQQKSIEAGAGVALGAGAGAIMKKASSKFGIGTSPSQAEIIPNSADLKQKAREMYRASEASGAVINANAKEAHILDLIESVTPKDAISRARFNKGNVSKALDDVTDLLNSGELTLEGADAVDKTLTKMISDEFKVGTGMTPEGVEIGKIQEKFRDFIENVNESQIVGGKDGFETLKGAREVWSRAKRLEDIENIIDRASLFQKHPATAIKTGLRQLINNKKKFNRYSPEEQKAIRMAGRTGKIDDLIETAGSRLLQIGGTLKGGVVGGTVAGVASQALRDVGIERQLNKVQDLSDLVATGGKSAENIATATPFDALGGNVASGTARATQPIMNQGDQAEQPSVDFDTDFEKYQFDTQSSQFDTDFDEFLKTNQPKKKPSFDNVMQHIFKEEGGYVADDGNTGQPANFGINQKANPDIDVKNLTKEKAQQIYKKRYWDKIGADKLSPAMQIAAMDAAVNQGVAWTRKAIEKSNGDLEKFKNLRIVRYKNIAQNPKKKEFLKSWLNRVQRTHENALEYV